MKIVFISNGLGGGGAEKQLLFIAAALSRAGHSCVIYTLQKLSPGRRLDALYQEVRAAGVNWEAPQTASRLPWRELRALRREVRSERWAVVWSWGHRADLAALALRLMNVRLVWICSLRDANDARMMRLRWLWWIIDLFVSGYASNSRRSLEMLDRIIGNSGQKGAVIMNALNFPEAPQKRDATLDRPAHLRIVMLGNILIHKKGYDVAVTLAARFRDEGLPFSIHIGGAPMEAERLRQLTELAGVGGILKMEGRVEAPLVFLGEGDVFLMLSRYEGTPNALLEAMSLGLPAVCTRVGDVANFARDRVHVRVVDPEDVEGTFQALRDLWQNWPEAVAMGHRGQELCRELFTSERMTADALALLERFTSEGAR